MSLTDDAIVRIKSMILEGRLRPGDKLPREPDLAEALGISRSSLREAVRALTLVRILDVRQGDGTYVTSLQPDLLMETMDFVVDLHQDAGILHLFEVRRALEPMAAERAAVLMSDDETAALTTLLDDLGPDPDIEALVANDTEFHHRIAAGSGNPVLCSLIDSLSGRTQRARLWRGLTQSDAVERTLREHRSIAAAIDQRQSGLARAWATVHIAGVEEWLRTAAVPSDGHTRLLAPPTDGHPRDAPATRALVDADQPSVSGRTRSDRIKDQAAGPERSTEHQLATRTVRSECNNPASRIQGWGSHD